MSRRETVISSLLEKLPEGESLDEVFSILAHQQRVTALIALRHARTPERLSNLARRIAGDSRHSGSEEIEQIAIQLHHCHLPRLAEAEFVTYDPDRATVELTERGRVLAKAVDR